MLLGSSLRDITLLCLIGISPPLFFRTSRTMQRMPLWRLEIQHHQGLFHICCRLLALKGRSGLIPGLACSASQGEGLVAQCEQEPYHRPLEGRYSMSV